MARILIADDSRFQVQLISAYLEPKGFAVVSAGDALQTWMKALREKPEAIVLDINMPGGTGIEVLKRLRMSARTHHIPVIVVSGSSEPNIESTVKDLGACDFLQKPVDPNQLCEMLSRLIAPASTKAPTEALPGASNAVNRFSHGLKQMDQQSGFRNAACRNSDVFSVFVFPMPDFVRLHQVTLRALVDGRSLRYPQASSD